MAKTANTCLTAIPLSAGALPMGRPPARPPAAGALHVFSKAAGRQGILRQHGRQVSAQGMIITVTCKSGMHKPC